MSSFARTPRVAFAVALTLLTSVALADKVATLHSKGTAPLADRTSMRTATELAAKGLGHVTVEEADVLQGEGAAGDKIGTSAGLVAVGKTTGADWVVVPSVASNVYGTHVELTACQVATGRVETLARDLDPKIEPTQQMREMLALLLRPQGVGDDPLPWEKDKKLPGATSASASASTSASVPPPPLPPPPTPPVVYGDGGKVALGVGGGAYDLVARPEQATGKRFAWSWSLDTAFTITRVPHLEVLARFGGVHGPGNALHGEVGARYFVVQTGRLAFGPELFLGGFGQLGGAKTMQLLVSAAPSLGIALTHSVQLDFDLGRVMVATGAGAGSVVLFGGEAAILARF